MCKVGQSGICRDVHGDQPCRLRESGRRMLNLSSKKGSPDLCRNRCEYKSDVFFVTGSSNVDMLFTIKLH